MQLQNNPWIATFQYAIRLWTFQLVHFYLHLVVTFWDKVADLSIWIDIVRNGKAIRKVQALSQTSKLMVYRVCEAEDRLSEHKW